nr:hypothetical protein [Tanacetum cinerariifolium]
VNDSTAREKAVVSRNMGREGNLQQKEYKEKRVIDSGCSRHVIGNKCYLTDFEAFDGGFVSFGHGKGRISGIGIENQLDYKVKVIRSDNGTKFKNSVVTQFCDDKDAKDSAEDAGKKAPKVDAGEASDNGRQDNQVSRSKDGSLFQQDRQTEHNNNTNDINIVSSPVSTAGPSFVNAASQIPFNAAGPSISTNAFEEHSFERFSLFKNAFSLPRVPIMTPIDDTGIFGNAYDDDSLPRPSLVQALQDPSWVEAMQEDLLQFKLLKVCTLVDLPKDKWEIGTKWVYRNKKDEKGIVIKNKARLVAQGHTQEEGIDYDEVFAPVARIKAIRLLLAFSSFKDFVVYQMDVKSAFPYGKIEEEVYVCQPPGFEDPNFPNKFYKVEKALYRLHQAPRLQVKQKSDGIFINQDKYVAGILKKFDFVTMKTASTLMESDKPLIKNKEAKDVDVHLYRSMIGSLMYLTTSRPDITFVVCACARFQVTPKTSHLHAVKRIFRYLKVLTRNPQQDVVNFLARDSGPRCQETILDVAAHTWFEATLKMFNESPLPRVNTLGSREDSLKLQELMVFCTNCLNRLLVVKMKNRQSDMVSKRNERIKACCCIIIGEEVNAVRLMLPSIKLQLLVLVNAAQAESAGFEQIIDFLKSKPIHYALTVNPTIYVSCVKQFWATAKVKRVNDQEHIQALVDKKKVIIAEDSIRSDLCFDDAEGTTCLLNGAIFKGLARICNQVKGMTRHKEMYVISSHTKKIFANMRRTRADFSWVVTPLFDNMMKKQNPKRKHMKEAEVSHDESEDDDHVPTPSSDPLPSGEDSYTLIELMVFCTSLQEQVFDLQEAKDAQSKEIAALKKKVSKLLKWRKSRSEGLKRLMKIGSGRRVKSPLEKDSLGAQEEASKQGRIIKEIDQDDMIALDVDTPGRKNDDEMFGVNDLSREEVVLDTTIGEHEEHIIEDVSTVKPVTTVGEVVTTIADKVSAAPTTYVTEDEITIAQALAALKSIKPKVVEQEQEVSTIIPAAATTVTTAVPTPRAKGMDSEAQKGSGKEAQESSTKRTVKSLESNISKKQNVDENVEPVINDTEELKKCMEIVLDDEDEVLIEATPISSRSPTIIDYKIHKE